MEQREIEIYLTLAEELHFGRTAQRLHVTPARVSQTIKKLEQQIGAALFERTSRQVALTSIGKQLRDDLEPAYKQILEGVQRATSAGRQVEGQLRIGFISALAGRFLMDVTKAFKARFPNCEVELRENQWADGFSTRLAAGGIDLLLATRPVGDPELVTGPVLFREDVLLAVSARHPFAKRPSVRIDDVAKDRFLATPPGIEAWDAVHLPLHTSDGRPIPRGPSFTTTDEMLALVGAGQGTFPVAAQAADFYARPDVAYVPLIDAPALEWNLIWRQANETRRIRAFVEVASEVASSSTD